MSNPPMIGQNPWGEDLNAYLATLEGRIEALENKTEYVYNSAPWQFSNAAPPATGSQVRLDNVNPSLATLVDMRLIDSDGADRSPWIRALATAGSRLQITDWDNATNTHRLLVTGTPTIGATNAQIPVSWVSGTGVIPNAKINVGFLVVL